jgi:iron-sulfur cluster repair protein YtfE (RIC family)
MSNIIDLLVFDHSDFRVMLAKLTTVSYLSDEAILFRQLFDRLKAHSLFEETSVYPLLTNSSDTKEIALEAFEEHRQFLHLLRALNELTANNDACMAKMHVLGDDLTHHILEEETYLLPQLRKSASIATLQMLGSTYQEMMDTAKSDIPPVEDHIRVR